MYYSINFYIDKVRNSHDQKIEQDCSDNNQMAKLRMRIRWGHGYQLSFGVGFMIRASGWDHKAQRCTRGSEHGKQGNIASWIVNARLEEMERLAHLIMDRCGASAPPDEVRKLLNYALGKKKIEQVGGQAEKGDEKLSLSQWLERFVQDQTLQKGWKKSTRKKYQELMGYLRAFAPKAELSDVSEKWLQGLLSDMLELGLRNVTIVKMLDMLNWFLRWTDARGLITDHSWLQFKPQLKCLPRKVLFLTKEELMRVFHLDLSNDRELDNARDLFCTLCFTSLRYSDLRQLKSLQVKDDHIELVTQKTSRPLIIELNNYSKAILNKHQGSHTPFAMPQMNIQRLNLLIKEIGRRANLNEMVQMVWYVGSERRESINPKWKLLTSHCGRRTFICNSLSMNIPAETVMRWTGHSSYKSMKPYIAVADESRRQEMKKWDSFE